MPILIQSFLRNYSKAGGIVFAETTDDEGFQDQWLPAPITCIEDGLHTNAEPTNDAGDLFEFPNKVNLAGIRYDDNFVDYDETKYTVLAQKSTKDRAEILMIENGKGLYIITGIDPEKESEELNKLYENVLTFFLSKLDEQKMSVESKGKLTTTWGDMKK